MKKILLIAVISCAFSLFAADGWRNLFAPDYSDGDFDPKVWHVDKDGCLTAEQDFAYWTKDIYSRFELECEYNLEKAANSGILIYCSDTKNWIPNAVEIQLMDNDAPKWKNEDPRRANLSFFGHKAPSSNPVKPAGEWNKINIVADGPIIKVSVNGILVNECDLSVWTDAKKLPDGTPIPPWLSRPWAELDTAGKIGFQGRHGGAGVKFRNIRIRPLPSLRKVYRLMSFNIRIGCGHDGTFRIEKGGLGFLPKCAKVIRKFNPDVCGIQEIDCKSSRVGGVDQTAALAKLAKMQGTWVQKISKPEYGLSTLYKERPFKVSKVLFKGSSHTRALMINEYPGFVVANTHFPLSKETRLGGVETVIKTLKPYTAKKPVFLMGDFNARPDSDEIAALKKCFTILSDVTQPTYPARKPKYTIDYIMVDNAHAGKYANAKCQVLAAPEATDHAAVVVDIVPDETVYPIPEKLGVKHNPTAIHIQRTMKKLEESTKENPAYVKIFFYGQSIVAQRWREDLMDMFRKKYPTVNFDFQTGAIGGFPAQNLIRTAESDLYPTYPDLLFFHVYGDLEKYEQIVKNVHERTTSEIVLWTSHLSEHQDPYEMLAKRDERSLGILDIAKRNRCMVIDLNKKWSEMLVANDWPARKMLRDGVHLQRRENDPRALRYYAGFIGEELCRIEGAEGEEDVCGTIEEIPFESDRVKKNKDGSISLSFEGNRVVAVSDGATEGESKVTLDDRELSSFHGMYANSRPSKLVCWMPMIRCVERKEGVKPVVEKWELTYIEGTQKGGPLVYKVEGSVTGFDGEGTSDADFVSNSGQVVIKKDDFHGAWQYKRFLGNPSFSNKYARVGQKIKWETYPLYNDTYKAQSADTRTVLVQNCSNEKHELKIIPGKGVKIGIKKFVIYKPAK